MICALYLSPHHHGKQIGHTILHTCKIPQPKMQLKSGEILSDMDLDKSQKRTCSWKNVAFHC